MKHFFIAIFFMLGCSFLFPPTTSAETLFLSPASGTYPAEGTIVLDLLVSTRQAVNAVSGELLFPSTILSPVSVHTQDSDIDLWVQKPSLSKETGKILFEGLILNPGLIGEGKVMSVTFQVKEAGTVRVTIPKALLLANDGFGTNVIEEVNAAELLFTNASSINTTVSLPESDAVQVVSPQSLNPPLITNYPPRVASLNDLAIRGITSPHSLVRIWLNTEEGSIEEHGVYSDEGGNFIYWHDRDRSREYLPTAGVWSAAKGVVHKERYQFWASTVSEGIESKPTDSFEVIVGGIDPFQLAPVVMVTLIAILVILILTLGFLFWQNHHGHRKVIRH